MDAVAFEGLTRSFGAVGALRGLTAVVPEGSVTALLGRNAAGKTTAIKCAVGLLRPDQGRAVLLGRDASALPAETLRHVGYVSERQLLDPRFRVGEFLDYAAAFYPPLAGAPDWDRTLARSLLERLGVDPAPRIGDLSLGQARKVALVANLAFRPRVLLLDEPAANLDAIARREFLELLLDWYRSEGLTVLFSTHQLGDVERVADRVIFIDEGRLLVAATLDDLKEDVKTLHVEPAAAGGSGLDPRRVHAPGALRVRRIGRALEVTVHGDVAQWAARLEEETGGRVTIVDLPLEDAFIALAGRGRTPDGADPLAAGLAAGAAHGETW